MSALVKLEDVSKRYGDAIALYPTNLSIESGKTTVLIGPSGCGKSTLLRLIIRLIESDSGSIEFDGKPVTPDNINSLRRRIGYVIQEGGLFPHLTARANVLLMARHIGKSEEETHNRLLELSELTRFSENLLPRYPVELSGGQRQRVSLMRALMLSPELFLLDEPLGALDPLVRASLQKDLKEIFTRLGQTVVFVTHDLAEAIYFADEIVLMNEGRIVQKGTITDLRERPADPFVSEFINAQRGTRALNEIGMHGKERRVWKPGSGNRRTSNFPAGMPFLLIFSCVSFFPTACTFAADVVIGSKKFTESYVLGEIAKRTLTDAGIPAEHRQGMGGTIILWEALRGGQIDAYPEYTGTIATEILKSDSGISLDQIRSSLEKVGVGMTAPLGFNNTYALVMRRSEAQRLGIRTISDLQRYPELKFGLTHEFLQTAGWLAAIARALRIAAAEYHRHRSRPWLQRACKRIDRCKGRLLHGCQSRAE